MLYILPPPIVPSPPTPWNSIVCGKHQQLLQQQNNNKKILFENQHINSTRINYVRPSPRRSRYRALFKFKNRFDSAGLDEDESTKSCKSLSECYFAGKGTALVLGQSESLRTLSDGTRLNLTTTNNVSSSITSETNTCGSDIQQHLQSMFYLLRPEETLKMAVKLESNRAGRTRYLVVVSRTEKNIIQQSTEDAQSIQENLTAVTFEPKTELTTITTAPTTFTTATAATTNTICPPSIKEDESCSFSDKLNNISIASPNNDNPIFYLNNNDNMINTTNINSNINTNTEQLQFFNDYCYDGDNDNKKKKNFSSANLIYPTTSEYLNSDDFCKNSYITSVNGSEREESCLLGIDCNEKTTVGLVLRILADTTIRLDGDGGFSVSVCGRTHIFKPVSVQAMWSALQTLHKVSSKAREQNYYPGGPSHDWVSYYERHIESDRSCLNEWHTMDSLESRRPPSPDTIRNKPTEREETERVIRTALKEIMMVVDLDEVTSKYIRSRLEEHLDMDLAEFKSFIDQEMLTILGQMDAPTEVFDHVYLGSEWNASNLEELQKNGVHHILNVTREIDNFFPGMFDYCNVRVYDDEKTDLLKHWDNTFKYITRAKINGSKVLVHCKMGVSRSASVVIAYAMKAYNWNFSQALKHVKEKRNCIKPNKSFITQLETYQGMLDAMKNKEKLQRSKSETNLKSPKDARLLPGSEPTPLIQALNVGKANLLNISGKDLRKIGNRPKSWSPDNVETSQVMLSKPQSQSLEHLCPQQEEKEAKNIRLPCSNGQNYSVSQNQAVHLQEESQMPIPSVKLIISELESNERRIKYDKKSLNIHLNDDESDEVHKEIWDPGENINIINKINNVNNTSSQNLNYNNDINQCSKIIRCDSPVWTSSAQIIHQTPIVSLSISETKDDLSSTITSLSTTTTNITTTILNNPIITTTTTASIASNNKERKDGDLFSSQLDRVFEREERKQSREQNIVPPIPLTISELITPSSMVSRQSSWSSVDSAVVLGDTRETPSRHSSWGSGDNRTIPSRNSSWGSYDMRHHCIIPQKNNYNNNNKLMKDDGILIGTSSSGIFPYDKDEIPWHPGTVRRTKQKIEELSVTKRLRGETNDENKPVNGGSSKIIPKEIDSSIIEMCLINKPTQPSRIQQSRSNSEEILVGTTSLSSSNYSRLSASAPETSAINFIDGKNNIPSRRYNFKSRFSVDESNKKKEDCDFQGAAGIVRNLKMNFEAKATAKNSENNKGRSLPSSPVAVHTDLTLDKFPTDIKEDNSDVINVKGLVDKYEVTKMRINTTAPLKQRPRSVFETKQIQLQTQSLSKPLMLNHSKIITTKTEESRRPPVSPTVKNAVGNIPISTNNNNIVTKTVNKKVQQHGKTHPLARLGLPKQRLNTASYNTM